jgi:hypothetical protein
MICLTKHSVVILPLFSLFISISLVNPISGLKAITSSNPREMCLKMFYTDKKETASKVQTESRSQSQEQRQQEVRLNKNKTDKEKSTSESEVKEDEKRQDMNNSKERKDFSRMQ